MVIRGHHRGSRGGFRGGRGGFRGRGGYHMQRNSVFIPFQPFDIEHCENHFPRPVCETQTNEDSKLSELLLQRNKMIVPATDVMGVFDEMFNQVKAACDELKKEGEEESIFEEVRKIGAYSNETIIAEVKACEVLLTMKEAPKLTEIESIAKHIGAKLGATYAVTHSDDNAEVIVTNTTTSLRANCFVSCAGVKIKGVTDENVPKKTLYRNFDMGKRSRWFDDFGQEPNVKVLARIIGDMRCRFEGFRGLSQWSCELLAHYCVTGTKFDESTGHMNTLAIASAFRRCLMVLSSGFFLPGSSGIRDPIERDGRSVHQNFTKTDQDKICATAQTLLRVVMQGATPKVIGLEPGNVCDEMQIIDGIVIQPSLPCHVEEDETTTPPNTDVKME